MIARFSAYLQPPNSFRFSAYAAKVMDRQVRSKSQQYRSQVKHDCLRTMVVSLASWRLSHWDGEVILLCRILRVQLWQPLSNGQVFLRRCYLRNVVWFRCVFLTNSFFFQTMFTAIYYEFGRSYLPDQFSAFGKFVREVSNFSLTILLKQFLGRVREINHIYRILSHLSSNSL